MSFPSSFMSVNYPQKLQKEHKLKLLLWEGYGWDILDMEYQT